MFQIKSEGYVHQSRGMQDAYYGKKEDMQKFDAQVTIKNARNVTATLKLRGMGMSALPNMGLRKLYDTKSLIYIHVRKSNRSSNEQFYQNAIGKRRPGDELLFFESKNITNHNRFPSSSIEYSNGEYLTYASFSFSVSTNMSLLRGYEFSFNTIVHITVSDRHGLHQYNFRW